MAANAPVTRDTLDFACFLAGGRSYGIDVLSVREIVRSQRVTPLPKSPPLVEGVLDLRGSVIPVVDLGRALHGEPCADSPEARVAVVVVNELVFGLRVEAAVDVISAPVQSLDEAPDLVLQAGYEALQAVVRRDGQDPILILSLEDILESIYHSGDPGAGSS